MFNNCIVNKHFRKEINKFHKSLTKCTQEFTIIKNLFSSPSLFFSNSFFFNSLYKKNNTFSNNNFLLFLKHNAKNESPKIIRLFSSEAKQNNNTYSVSNIRNIGISAHIDSGKTTLTERILYYTGRIKKIHEVRGSDGVGAKMDSMELEREKGITIQSAATYCKWEISKEENQFGKDKKFKKEENNINIIDTPGHVDFTIEVERSLRVLDSAILVCCGVSAVQSQTLTVHRQMNRYNIPRIIFINKLDRDGADPFRAIQIIRQKLHLTTAAIQIPIGLEGKHKGIIDVIKKKAFYFLGKNGEERIEENVPDDYVSKMNEVRSELLETLADIDDNFADLYIQGEDKCTDESIHAAIRCTTLNRKFCPILMGSAKANKGIQNLLDAVCMYLPAPNEIQNVAYDQDDGENEVKLTCDPKKPLVAFAFKIQDLEIGQLSYFRIYQGTIKKNDAIYNMFTRKKLTVKRILKMHSDEAKECDQAFAGEIIAVGGIECNSGTTFTDGKIHVTLSPMYVPEPVVSLSIKPTKREDLNRFAKAINRFQREDPTFKVHVDDESKETIMSGMGELHLAIYIERMKREYNVNIVSGEPKVNFREAITQKTFYDYTHKKQTGGAGQYGKISGYFEPIETNPEDFNSESQQSVAFVNKVIGNSIPPNYIQSIEKGFRECSLHGLLTGHAVINIRYVLLDGNSHEVDSSDLAFKAAATGAFREFYLLANPIVLEPIMRVEASIPIEFQTQGISSINKRKGSITNTSIQGSTLILYAEVPLKDMFGYISDLRSCTQGQGEFSMEFERYQPMNTQDQNSLIEKYQKQLKEKK